ncbi:MAG: hypothetical protein C5B50_04510 [Verrucomicrobia bacterium]|nr:MAG: hypothetical protein C5B50_04510 [Verrucomicrobiota bacterium]
MAKILDDSSLTISHEVVDERRKAMARMLVFTAGLFSVSGIFLGVEMQKSPLWSHALAFAGMVVLLRVVFISWRRKIESLGGGTTEASRSAPAESLVGQTLEGFPDSFRVIVGPNTAAGKVDYVVVGPTGLYAIDEKNWKGTVTADGTGELLWNGYRPDRPLVKEFAERVEAIQSGLRKHRNGSQPQARGLLVFTDAMLKIDWDMHGVVQCIMGDELRDAILGNKQAKVLKDKEVESISEALMAIAKEVPREEPVM